MPKKLMLKLFVAFLQSTPLVSIRCVGTNTMSGKQSGVQTRFRVHAPSALYIQQRNIRKYSMLWVHCYQSEKFFIVHRESDRNTS